MVVKLAGKIALTNFVEKLVNELGEKSGGNIM